MELSRKRTRPGSAHQHSVKIGVVVVAAPPSPVIINQEITRSGLEVLLKDSISDAE